MGATAARSTLLLLISLTLVACSSSQPGSGFEQVEAVADSPSSPTELVGRAGKCELDEECASSFPPSDCRIPACTPDGQCVALPQPDGTGCDDGNACTAEDACESGTCAGGTNTCDCEDDAGCDSFQDPNLCHARLVCADGTCQLDPSTEVVCEDSVGQGCFESLCIPDTGTCEPANRPDGAPCEDGDPCTTASICEAGICGAGSSLECAASGPCTSASCDPVLGCVEAPVNDGETCNDGNACTENDVCAEGVCTPGDSVCICQSDADCAPFQANACEAPLVCLEGECVVSDEGTPCPDPDGLCMISGCDPETKECLAVPAENGTPCGMGEGCASQSICQAGVCVVSDGLCDDDNPCTTDTCDLVKDCVHVPVEAGCDDGDPCTDGDACVEGVCQSGTPACDCEVAEDCAGEGFNHCLGEPSCNDGTCGIVPGTEVQCEDGAGAGGCKGFACEPATGECVAEAVEDGAVCISGDPCLVGQACQGGVCEGGTPKCDDGNPCTGDACAPDGACTNSAINGSCDDGNACTTSDTCIAGSCFGGAVLKCTSDNACITASCDKQDGCIYKPVEGQVDCDDGDACTVDDQCLEGGCAGTSTCECEVATDCVDDGNPCNGKTICVDNLCVVDPDTVVTCPDLGPCLKSFCNVESGQCDVAPTGAGQPCSSAGACTQNAVCDEGTCVGEPVVCDDQNPCTAATCDEASGECVFIPALDWGCDDGDPCTVKDQCSDGVCVGTSPFACDDSDACTEDFCEPGVGCKGTDIVCDDQDPCTIDLCDPDTGCSFVPKCDAAVDLVPCTQVTCDASTGTCGTGPVANGSACVPNSVCTDDGSCEAGQCVPSGDGLTCDDQNACTQDLCDDQTGCVHDEISCDDGDLCTVNSCDAVEGCLASPKCQEDEPGDCDVPVCDPDDGQCGVGDAPAGTECDPLGACFATGACSQGGLCIGDGQPTDCDDDDVCTADGCVPFLGCQHTPLFTGSCDDGDACTDGDSCGVGGCSGDEINCADDDPCTADSCNGDTGCVHEPIEGCGDGTIACNQGWGSPCNDQDPATDNDVCIQGICRGFERLYLTVEDEGVDLALTHVDRAHDMWFITAEHDNTIGELFALKGYSEGEYDVSLFDNVSPEGNSDLSPFVGLHNGFAVTSDGWLIEYVPDVNGGFWTDQKPLSTAFADDGFEEPGCLWASGPSGSAGAVWLGGRHGDEAHVRFCHSTDLENSGTCTYQALPDWFEETVPRAIFGVANGGLFHISMGLDEWSPGNGGPWLNHTVENFTGVDQVWAEGFDDPGPDNRVTQDMTALDTEQFLVVGTGGYVRHRKEDGGWSLLNGLVNNQDSHDFGGAWTGAGGTLLAVTRLQGGGDVAHQLWAAPAGSDVTNPGSWTIINLDAGTYAPDGLYDVWGAPDGTLRLVGAAKGPGKRLGVVYSRKP